MMNMIKDECLKWLRWLSKITKMTKVISQDVALLILFLN
jgi:hypothetical protein